MGTIAQKLTYLNGTKQLLKENINNLGGNLTTEPFRQYASVLEGIYERLPKVSGIGASLSLSPSMVGKIKLNEIQGDTNQNGTPTPSSPVPIQSVTGLQNVVVCGKNLLDTSSFYNGYVDSSGNIQSTGVQALFNYIRVNPGESYTISSQGTVNSLNIAQYDINKNFISRTVQSNNPRTFTLGNTTYYIRIWTKVSDDTPMTQTIVNGLKLQFEQGSTATTYEPYKGNTYEVNLGKNLLNASQENYTFNANVNNSRLPVIGTIDLKANTKYYISYNVDSQMASNTRSTPYLELGSSRYYQSESNNQNLTIGRKVWEFTPTTSGTYNFGYWSHTPDVDLTVSKFMISKSSNTSYSPYFTPIELNKIGDYQDRIYKDNGKWYITKNIGKVVLDGSEANWSKSGNTTFDRFILGTNIHGIVAQGGYSNYFKVVNINVASNLYEMSNNGNSQLVFNYSTYGTTDLPTFKTWLGTHNIEVLYVLDTPTTTEITNTTLIQELESLNNAKSKDGTTNINVTSQDLAMLMDVSVIKGAE